MSTLIKIKGKYYKKCNVVMLPTEDKTEIVKHHYKLSHSPNKTSSYPENSQYQHLYITSDDEIKEEKDDWCIHLPTKEVVKYPKGGFPNNHYKKIIATTDKSLFIELKTPFGQIHHHNNKYNGTIIQRQGKHYINLPQISQSFIKKYCELGGIDEVLVEYYDDKVGYAMYSTPNWKLKTYPHNTITIKSVKNSWSKEEVIDIFNRLEQQKFVTVKKREDWIKQNLN